MLEVAKSQKVLEQNSALRIESPKMGDKTIPCRNSKTGGTSNFRADQLTLLRGAPFSCAGEEHNVRISGPTQQLLYSKSHDFRGIFALAHSKIYHKALKVTQLTGGILARISLKKMHN